MSQKLRVAARKSCTPAGEDKYQHIQILGRVSRLTASIKPLFRNYALDDAGCPVGTTITVEKLFYNTPARLKFLKSDSAESGMIIDFMSQMALAYKSIKFRFINNGTVLFSTAGDGNRFNTIVRVYKNVDPKNLIPVSYTEGKLRLEGYISTPAQTKNSRSSQVFFVNGRVVHSKVMEKGLAEGYRERIFDGRHPVAYLFLETDPADLDVNIHPNKREVRFDHEADYCLC